MSTSPSASTEIKDSDSESDRSSPVQSSQQPFVSTRSKARLLPPTTPQPPSSRTRPKKWMVNSTKMHLRSSHTKPRTIEPVVNSPAASPGNVEIVESVAESGTASTHSRVSNPPMIPSPTPSSARSIRSEMFNEVFLRASDCRSELKVKYQGFLRGLDANASHCGHLVEPPTVESKIPISVQRPTLKDLTAFLYTAVSRTFWETANDLQETELLVFKTWGHIGNVLKANPILDESGADVVMSHFATITTAIDAFCARLSAHLALTPEQSAVFDEDDLMDFQRLCFRLVTTDELPAVDDRFRLLWAVGPIHAMRARFLAWSNALSGSNAALRAHLETISANIDRSKTMAHGLKRKAEEEGQADS